MRSPIIRSKAVNKLLSALVFLSLAFPSLGPNQVYGKRAQRPLAEPQTEIAVVNPTRMPAILSESCTITDGLGRLTVDNSLGNGATHGCLIDYSSFPVVRVTVHNDHGFWTKISLFDSYGDVLVVADNVWAKLGYIAPDSYAEYVLTFDSSYNSRATFFVNAARSEDGRPSAGWWNIVSKILSVLNIDLVGAQLGDLQYVLQAVEGTQHLALAVDALSRFDLLKFLTELHEALEDEAEIDILIAIASRFGQTVSISTFKAIFTSVKVVLTAKDTWETVWTIVTGSYAGSVVFTSQVQPDPPPPPPIPTPPPLSTPTPFPPTDNATFVSDLALPDGTTVSPGQSLRKIWRVRNSGTSTWGSGYALAFIGGDQMGAPSSVDLPYSVAPGQTVDIGVNITAPSTEGTYQGNWRMRNPQGTYFGDTLWVTVQVGTPSSNIVLTADPPSPASADQVRIYARVNDFPNLRALRILVDGAELCQLGAPEIQDCVWHTNGYSPGQHAISAEADDWTGPSWDNPERRAILYEYTGSGVVNHVPYRPILVANPAYDWYVTIGDAPQLCAQQQGDPEGDAVNQYRFVATASVGTVDSGWVGSSCHSFGSITPGTYEWHAQVRNSRGGVSDWSDSWHFTTEPTGVDAYIDHFIPASPSSAEEVKIYGCTSGHAGVNITMRVLVNDANDGSDAGEWHIIKEQGSPCFNDTDIPIWRTLEYGDGPHLVRLVAWAIQPDAGDIYDTVYTLNHRRPASPRLVAPVPPSGVISEPVYLNTRTIAFKWEPAIRADTYTLHVSDDPSPSSDPSPVFRQTFGSSVTEYTITLDQDYAALYWQVEATNDVSSNYSGAQRFGIDRQDPACTVSDLASPSNESVFQVNWDGTDNLAGIRSFDIQFMDSERGTWENWLTTIPSDKTYDLFTGQPGHMYFFRCRATDQAANTGDYPGSADTSMTVDPAARPSTPWWDSAYAQKRNITVLNNMPGTTMPAGYPVHLHFDSSTTPTAVELYDASLSTPKCNDLRIVTGDTTELDRVVQNCSSTAIDIWFRSHVGIPGGTSDNTSHQLYSGSASAGAPPSDPNQVWYPYREANTTYLYYLQEGSGAIAYDSSGNGRNCSIDPSVQWSSSKYGYGLRFNRANYGDSRSLNCGSAIPLSAFTVEFWYKPDADDGGRIAGELAGGGNGGGGSNWLVQNQEGRIRLDTWPCPGCGSSEVRSNFNLRDAQYTGKWNHIAVTFSGSNEVKFYINGALDSTKYLSQSGINTYTPPLEIGSAEGIGQIKANLGAFRISNGVKTSFPYGSFVAIANEPTTAVGQIIAPPTTGSADLVMLSLSTYPDPSGGVLVEAVVQNQGELDTLNGFYTDLYVDHLPTGPGDYAGSLRFWVNDPIAAGETVVLTTIISDTAGWPAMGTLDTASAAERSGTLYAQADSAGAITEPNDVDNIHADGVQICLADPDAYESDDTAADANPLDRIQAHNLHRPGDQDWFQLAALGGVTYTIQTDNLGLAADTVLYLYDTDSSTLLASNDDYGGSLASRIDWAASSDGMYYLLIEHWNPNVGGCGTSYDMVVTRLATTLLVNSTGDRGDGTLRWALEMAVASDTIEFDTAVFPPAAPATITLQSPLPPLDDGNVTLDGSDAGAVVDGSSISDPRTVLLDDISLTLSGGANLLVNGDFSAGFGHWRPYDQTVPAATRGLSTADYHSAPQAYEWSTVPQAGDSRTVYDTTDSSDRWAGWPFGSDSTAWIPASGGQSGELRFWYRYAELDVALRVLYADGSSGYAGWDSFDWVDDWTEGVVDLLLPEEAVAVALQLDHTHPYVDPVGLDVISDYNVVRGLQIVGFDTGISLAGDSNVIGGDRTVGAGPLGQGNLISGNTSNGVLIFHASQNVIRGNYIGTDLSGTAAWPNYCGVLIVNYAHENTIGGTSASEGNLITGNNVGIEMGWDAMHNTVVGNLIGTDASGNASIGNSYFGILLLAGASQNLIGGSMLAAGNVIAYSGLDGVHVEGSDSLSNTLSHNRIHDNARKGIELEGGGNAELAAPMISAYDLAVGTLSGTACANCVVEVFSDSEDEGEIYEGQTMADEVGMFSLALSQPFVGPHLTATVTDADGNTSEFSRPTSRTVTQAIPAGDAPPVAFSAAYLTLDCSSGSGGTVEVTRHNVDYSDPPSSVGTMSGYWEISSDFEDSFSCDLIFTYEEADLNGATEGDIAGAARWDAGNVVWAYVGSTVDTDANTVTVADVTAFSDWLLLTSTPPQAVTGLDGTRSGSDLQLVWPAVAHDILGGGLTPDHYVVYRRADEPYFAPTPSDVIDTPSTPSFTDPGVLGDLAHNHYYVVAAVDGAGIESALSNRLGAFDFALTPAAQVGERAYNLIAVNLELPGVVDADSLAAYVGSGVYMVLRHDAATQAIVWRLPGLAGTNFPVTVGDAVYLYLDETAPDVVSLVGGVPAIGTVRFDLTPADPGGSCAYNFISLPLHRDDLADADALAADIGGVYSVSKWNAETQDLTWRMPGGPGENFEIQAGYPYIVCLGEAAPPKWP